MNTTTEPCLFCLPATQRQGDVLFEDELWFYVTSIDPVLSAGGLIVTRRHILSPFEINAKEWQRLHELLPRFKQFVDAHEPHGYNLGWNVHPVGGQHMEHAHLHFFGRFEDEPLAYKGLRSAFKDPANQRQSKDNNV